LNDALLLTYCFVFISEVWDGKLKRKGKTTFKSIFKLFIPQGTLIANQTRVQTEKCELFCTQWERLIYFYISVRSYDLKFWFILPFTLNAMLWNRKLRKEHMHQRFVEGLFEKLLPLVLLCATTDERKHNCKFCKFEKYCAKKQRNMETHSSCLSTRPTKGPGQCGLQHKTKAICKKRLLTWQKLNLKKFWSLPPLCKLYLVWGIRSHSL